MTRADIVIQGRVQGVFYRATAQQEGLRLGLVGVVRNLPDGGVEAEVEGPKEAVEDFIAWCRKGPARARVDEVQVKWSEPRAEYRTFVVER